MADSFLARIRRWRFEMRNRCCPAVRPAEEPARGPGWLIAAVRRASGVAWRASGVAWRALGAAWRALPGDLLGRVVLNGCHVRAGSGRLVPRRGLATSGAATLVEDPRLARFLDAVPLRPGAVTLGRYILARGPLADPLVRHELEHVRQWSRLGPLFLPLYLAESARQALRGGDRYLDNWFERMARARERQEIGPTALSPEPG